MQAPTDHMLAVSKCFDLIAVDLVSIYALYAFMELKNSPFKISSQCFVWLTIASVCQKQVKEQNSLQNAYEHRGYNLIHDKNTIIGGILSFLR